jgi:hypothetical protein
MAAASQDFSSQSENLLDVASFFTVPESIKKQFVQISEFSDAEDVDEFHPQLSRVPSTKPGSISNKECIQIPEYSDDADGAEVRPQPLRNPSKKLGSIQKPTPTTGKIRKKEKTIVHINDKDHHFDRY